VYASERLSFTRLGKASRGKAKVKTGIGKSDLPGLQGARGNVTLSVDDQVRASRLYPDPSLVRVGVRGYECDSTWCGKVLRSGCLCGSEKTHPCWG
jgi:hypothetical protein